MTGLWVPSVGSFSLLRKLRSIAIIGVNHQRASPSGRPEEPEGDKVGFVSGYMAGLRHCHDSLPKSKESLIRALEKAVTNTAVHQQP